MSCMSPAAMECATECSPCVPGQPGKTASGKECVTCAECVEFAPCLQCGGRVQAMIGVFCPDEMAACDADAKCKPWMDSQMNSDAVADEPSPEDAKKHNAGKVFKCMMDELADPMETMAKHCKTKFDACDKKTKCKEWKDNGGVTVNELENDVRNGETKAMDNAKAVDAGDLLECFMQRKATAKEERKGENGEKGEKGEGEGEGKGDGKGDGEKKDHDDHDGHDHEKGEGNAEGAATPAAAVAAAKVVLEAAKEAVEAAGCDDAAESAGEADAARQRREAHAAADPVCAALIAAVSEAESVLSAAEDVIGSTSAAATVAATLVAAIAVIGGAAF